MVEVIKGQKISDKLIEKIKELYNAGNSARFVSKELGVSKTTVLKYVDGRKQIKMSDSEKKKKNVIAVQKRRNKLKVMAVEYKGGRCQVEECGYNKCLRALEFHHLDPNEKDFSVGEKGYTMSWEKVKNELDKCIMVCANCHREIHEAIENEKHGSVV